MKKTKCFPLFLAFFLILALMLPACGKSLSEAADHNRKDVEDNLLAPGEKIELTLAACYADWTDLGLTVVKFNQNSDRYHVTFKDYSNGGAPDLTTNKQLLTKINTEIISGDSPDMLCFDYMSPLPYVRRGLLADMGELFECDEELNLEDLAIAAALKSQKGIYYLGRTFTYSTMVGLFSNFGDRYGWTFSEYLEFEKMRPAGTAVIYNETRPIFIDTISQLYLPFAIDWENGTCNFVNDDFIAILEAAGRIQETPLESLDIGFGHSETFVGTGQLIVGVSGGNSVWELALGEQRAGARLSCVGRPTADGSCGSTVRLEYPVGIMANSEHIEGCWEFIKFMLKDVGLGEQFAMPIYLPALQEVVEDAKTNEDNPILMTDEDADRFSELLKHFDKLEANDETVLGIIADESVAFFNGYKTASETAQLIQDKVNIYLGELA